MAGNSNKNLASPVTRAPALSAAGAATTVTITAPTNPTQTIYVYGFQYSAQAAPTVTTTFTITGLVGGTLTHEIPASAYAPIVVLLGTHPFRATVSTNVVATLGAHNGTTVGSVELLYQVDTAP